MKNKLNKQNEYILSWEYIEEIGKVLSEEFDNFDRDKDGNNRLKIIFNENVGVPEDLRVKSNEVRGYLMGVSILAMTRVIERGYIFPPNAFKLFQEEQE